MRIGIDASVFTDGKMTGIARSVDEVITQWMINNPDNEYYLLSGKRIAINKQLPPNWHIVDTPWIMGNSLIWFLIKLPLLIKELRLDVYWGTNFILPYKVKHTKYIVSIYDLALFKFNNIGAFKNTVKLKLFTKSACNKADKIIAISKATAEDIKTIMGIRDEKICVSYCGGPSETENHSARGEINPLLDRKKPFFLFVSTIEPRKNIKTIVKAYEKFRNTVGKNYDLILAGKRGWKCDDIYELISASPYVNDIVLPGYISESDKDFLFRNAECFVYPSVYEGFGIPILEAFQYNLPVITSNVSSMPEVGGDAAFYVNNPYDEDELKNRMITVSSLTDEELRNLKIRIQKQLMMFSWKKNADEIMNVIRQLQ